MQTGGTDAFVHDDPPHRAVAVNVDDRNVTQREYDDIDVTRRTIVGGGDEVAEWSTPSYAT